MLPMPFSAQIDPMRDISEASVSFVISYGIGCNCSENFLNFDDDMVNEKSSSDMDNEKAIGDELRTICDELKSIDEENRRMGKRDSEPQGFRRVFRPYTPSPYIVAHCIKIFDFDDLGRVIDVFKRHNVVYDKKALDPIIDRLNGE